MLSIKYFILITLDNFLLPFCFSFSKPPFGFLLTVISFYILIEIQNN